MLLLIAAMAPACRPRDPLDRVPDPLRARGDLGEPNKFMPPVEPAVPPLQGWDLVAELDPANFAPEAVGREWFRLARRGYLLHSRDLDPAAALPLFDAALDLQPDRTPLWLLRGDCLSMLGDGDAAMASCHHALSLDTGDPAALTVTGLIAESRGDAEWAVELLRAAIQCEPGNVHALNGLAWLQATGPARVRDWREALRNAQRAVLLTGYGVAEFLDTLAHAQALRMDLYSAIRAEERAVRLSRGDPRFQRALDRFWHALAQARGERHGPPTWENPRWPLPPVAQPQVPRYTAGN